MDTNVLDDFVPTPTEMEEIERVILENDVFPMNSEDVKEEDHDMVILVTCISNLEKTQGDILTLLQSLNDRFNAILESPLESVRKQV